MEEKYKEILVEIVREIPDYFIAALRLNNRCDHCKEMSLDIGTLIADIFFKHELDIFDFAKNKEKEYKSELDDNDHKQIQDMLIRFINSRSV